MINWLKNLFRKKHGGAMEIVSEPKMLEKPCRSCGKSIFYDPSWDHIPNYCRECREKYRQDHDIIRVMKRKCRKCGKEFRFPSNLRHYPNYCKKCRAQFKAEKDS